MQDPPDVEDVIIKLESELPVCRVCLQTSTEYIEFESTLCFVDGIDVTYLDGFNLIAPNMSKLLTKSPNTFCSSCGNELLNAFLFRKRIENANIILTMIHDITLEKSEGLFSEINNKSEILDNDQFCEEQLETLENDDGFDVELEDNYTDLIAKEVNTVLSTEPKVRSKKKKQKISEIDQCWPASPKNSLYTDSDSESNNSMEILPKNIDVDKEKSTKFSEPIIWMCNDCDEIWMSERMLKKHRKRHLVANIGEAKCKHCGKSFGSIEQLEIHLCFHKFSEQKSDDSGNVLLRCKLCERKYRNEETFTDHINIHKNKKPHCCEKCSQTFHTKSLLKVHEFRFHRNMQRKIKKTQKKASVEKKEKCLHCDKMVRKSYMEIHKEIHFGPTISTCNECDKQFGSLLALRTHSLIHKQRGEFPCHICNKMCQTMYGLKSHISFKHLMDKPRVKQQKSRQHQCEECGIIFQYASKLSVHRRIHTAETPFQCPHCDRKYMRKDQFNIHMRYHSNDLPYKCDRCDKCYATRNNLSEHTKSVHDKITHDCDQCSLKFKSSTGLKKHKFFHTGYPYVCPICGIGQPFRSGIKAHLLRVHKDTFTEDEFEKAYPDVNPKSGFRRPKY